MTNPAALPTTIAPWLSLRNGARAVEFYKSAFGATEVFRMEEGGSVVAAFGRGRGVLAGGRVPISANLRIPSGLPVIRPEPGQIRISGAGSA